MLDLKSRYLKSTDIPDDKYILALVTKDHGEQDIEGRKRFQIEITVPEKPGMDYASELSGDYQLILSYKARCHLATLRQKRNLSGTLFEIRKSSVKVNRTLEYYFTFSKVRFPDNQIQTTLLNDVVCITPRQGRITP